jgi:hypothetical protein
MAVDPTILQAPAAGAWRGVAETDTDSRKLSGALEPRAGLTGAEPAAGMPS